jgi:hypothetical protein
MRLKKEFGGSGTAAALARHAATRHQARRRGQDITHVAAIRRTEDERLGARCVTQRRPYGDDPWAQPAAEQSGLESPRRTRGRSPGQPIKDSRHLWPAQPSCLNPTVSVNSPCESPFIASLLLPRSRFLARQEPLWRVTLRVGRVLVSSRPLYPNNLAEVARRCQAPPKSL